MLESKQHAPSHAEAKTAKSRYSTISDREGAHARLAGACCDSQEELVNSRRHSAPLVSVNPTRGLGSHRGGAAHGALSDYPQVLPVGSGA